MLGWSQTIPRQFLFFRNFSSMVPDISLEGPRQFLDNFFSSSTFLQWSKTFPGMISDTSYFYFFKNFSKASLQQKLDSIAASLFENSWLSWQIVSDDKIRITLLILGRGALSRWTRIRSSHQGCQLPCESCEDNISAGESQCRLQAAKSGIARYLGVVTQFLHILHMSCSCGSLLCINNM